MEFKMSSWNGVDTEAIERKLEEATAKNANRSNTWKPEKGTTKVRILPYLYDLKTFFITLNFHYGLKGKSWCLRNEGKKCPICEKASALWSQGDAENNDYKKKLAKELFPRTRHFAPIVVAGQESEGPKVWGFSDTVLENLKTINSDVSNQLMNPVSGGYVKITVTPPDAKHRYGSTVASIDFESWMNRTPIANSEAEIEAIMNAQQNISDDLFVHATYEELIEAFNEFVDKFKDTPGESNLNTSKSAEESVIDGMSKNDSKQSEKTEDTKSPVVTTINDSIDMDDIEAQFKDLLTK